MKTFAGNDNKASFVIRGIHRSTLPVRYCAADWKEAMCSETNVHIPRDPRELKNAAFFH